MLSVWKLNRQLTLLYTGSGSSWSEPVRFYKSRKRVITDDTICAPRGRPLPGTTVRERSANPWPKPVAEAGYLELPAVSLTGVLTSAKAEAWSPLWHFECLRAANVN
jgi:hypothetical protein